MKYQKPNLLSWLWALSLFSVLIIGPGCQTPKERVIFNTLYSTKQIVLGSMRSADALHKADSITDAQWDGVANKYDNEFTPAFQTAVDLAHFDYNAPTPENVGVIANQIITTVSTFKKD